MLARSIIVAIVALLPDPTSVVAQVLVPSSSLDTFSGDFFDLDSDTTFDGSIEVAGNQDYVDNTERPQPPKLSGLPNTMQEVPIAQSTSLSPELQAWVRWLVLKNLPPVYEDNRKWGKTEEVYNGFRFRREGLKVETYTKYRTVKQGTWSRYFIEFVDPSDKLEISINQIRPVAADRFAFQVNVRTPLRLFGRISQWQRDIQLISLSTNADATVSMSVDCECGIAVNSLTFPPDIQFKPQATNANVVIESFEVHRISQLSGPLAEQLGKGILWVLEDRLEKYNDKLVQKINRQLAKQEDKLTIKLQDELSGIVKSWTSSAEP